MNLHLPDIWILLGFVCILLEFILPGAIIVFFGTSAILTGLMLKFGLPTTGGLPFWVFMVLSAGQIWFLRKHVKSWFTGSSIAAEEQGVEEFLGKPAVVVRGFENGSDNGIVEFKGASWQAVSSDTLLPGERVVITRHEGLTLYVSKK